ncbi:MAG: hypothetical protein LBS61_00335 [Endomicrobium sp.]|jgi:NhaP-type Na+/H+ or K+/H+ antiporter|nr:hypothetical protein [Endomicrobium sp.]
MKKILSLAVVLMSLFTPMKGFCEDSDPQTRIGRAIMGTLLGGVAGFFSGLALGYFLNGSYDVDKADNVSSKLGSLIGFVSGAYAGSGIKGMLMGAVAGLASSVIENRIRIRAIVFSIFR